MNSIQIYRRSNEPFRAIKPQPGSVHQSQLMGEDVIKVRFISSVYLDFKFGDWCMVFGKKFVLRNIPFAKKTGQNNYEFNLTAVAESLEFEKAQFLFLGADNTLRETDFSLMASPLDFLNLVVANANRISTGWQVGSVQVPNNYKNITFSSDNCLTALQSIAQNYGTEYHVIGKTISLGVLANAKNITFRHGKGNGLYEINRQEKESATIVTRLYAYGSERNLIPGYRNFSKRLKLPGGIDFIENNVSKYGIIENTVVFDDIYPRREGTVTNVAINDPFYFQDDDMDFDLNGHLLPAVMAKVTFNTGQLAGLTFEIRQYSHASKAFYLLLNKDNAYIDLPNNDIRPQIGDKYVLVDIRMPEEYIAAAETELADRAGKLLLRISEPEVSYQVRVDQKFVKENNLVIEVGDLVRIEDIAMNVSKEIRVVSTTRDIVNENEITFELSDTVQTGTITKLQVQQEANGRAIAGVSSQLQNNRQLQGQYVGNLRINDGTLIIPGMPQTDNLLSKYPVYWDEARGALRYYKP